MQVTWKKVAGVAAVIVVIMYGVSVWWSVEPDVLEIGRAHV